MKNLYVIDKVYNTPEYFIHYRVPERFTSILYLLTKNISKNIWHKLKNSQASIIYDLVESSKAIAVKRNY